MSAQRPRPVGPLRLWALLLALALPSPAPWAQGAPSAPPARYFASNALGSPLEEIGWWRREEFPYVLVVESRGELEVRRLLHQGEERQRWERAPTLERRFLDGALAEELLFDPRGRVVEERQFDGGDLATRRVLFYGPDVRDVGGPAAGGGSSGPLRAEVFDAQGRLLYEDRFLLSPRGELLRVLRLGPEDQRQELSLAGREGRVYEERHRAGGQEWVNRYDGEGRLVGRELWEPAAAGPVQRQTLEYGEGVLRSVRTRDLRPGSGQETLERYDEQGRLFAVVVEREGRRIQETRFLRDAEGRLLEKQSRSEEGLEQWLYSYGPEGALEREVYSQRGAVRTVTTYGAEGSRVEELYRNGEVVLRVHFAGSRKLREETVADGQVVRVKEYP